MSTVDRTRPPAPAAVRAFEFPRIQRDRLDNGLAVLTARHGALPVVTIELVVDAGAATEPDDRAGVAGLTLEALEAGTTTRDEDRIARDFEQLGVELVSGASWDAAIARITVPAERLEPAMALLAEVVRNPVFPEAPLSRMRAELLASFEQRKKRPGALAGDALIRHIFAPGVPYARPSFGTRETVEATSRDDVEAFYRERYRPNAAALLFVGDVDAETARRLAERHFADWTAGDVPATDFDVAPGVESRTIFVVDRPGSVQSEIRIGDVGVSRHHPDYFRLVVMNAILGGVFTSRLNMNLRERHGFTYGARSGFAFRKKPGPFTVQAAVATDVTARALEEAIREIELLREDGATEAEVENARDYLVGVQPLRLQTTGQLAAQLADLVVYDLPDDYFLQYRDRIAAVTPDDVLRVAREHLRPERHAIVIVGDAKRIVPPLEALGKGPVVVEGSD